MNKVEETQVVSVVNTKTQQVSNVSPTVANYMTAAVKDAAGNVIREAEWVTLDSSKSHLDVTGVLNTKIAELEVINAQLTKDKEDLQLANDALNAKVVEWEDYVDKLEIKVNKKRG